MFIYKHTFHCFVSDTNNLLYKPSNDWFLVNVSCRLALANRLNCSFDTPLDSPSQGELTRLGGHQIGESNESDGVQLSNQSNSPELLN